METELNKLDAILQEKPDIVMTHFIPTAEGIIKKYQAEITNAFFYFNADEFLSKMKLNSIWHCGHTHDSSKKILSIKNGIFPKKINLLVNPIGYPFETNKTFSLKSRSKDFLW